MKLSLLHHIVSRALILVAILVPIFVSGETAGDKDSDKDQDKDHLHRLLTMTSIESIGIYNCYTGLPPALIPFCRACGYNTYQRWDLGWTLWPEHHDQFYTDFAQEIDRMHAAGFKVYVLLNLNMVQRR